MMGRLSANRDRLRPGVFAVVALLLGAAVLSGCHQDMWNQRRYEPFERGDFFGEGESSSRTFVAGTVPYKLPKTDTHYYEGRVNGEFASELPEQITLNLALLQRGQERFGIYCMPCHGAQGLGNGMIPQRGFPNPPAYTDQRLLESPIGYFFDVMTNGFGRMYNYAGRVTVDDRWAIATYIRTLQLSQNATPALLPEDILAEARAVHPGEEISEH